MTSIHQILAGFSRGDAISNEALELRNIFRSWGYESEIYCERTRILPALRKEARDVEDLPGGIGAGDVAVLHLSIGSDVNGVFKSLSCHKAILYHNSTPPEYFELINPQIASDLKRARAQMKDLAGSAQVNMADSAFNARELEMIGYRDVSVLPLVADLGLLRNRVCAKTLKTLSDGRTNVLFVGRCAPNKKIEDALKIFFYFKKYAQPDSRFIHVGSFAGAERYRFMLLALCRDLGLNDVTFAGSVPQDQLNAYYRGAHLFLCASEHEGFCMPLIEAMCHHVPVMAFAAGAVPETMDGSGILFARKDYALVAEMMAQVLSNKDFRESLVRGQDERVARYENRHMENELRQIMAPLLNGGETS